MIFRWRGRDCDRQWRRRTGNGSHGASTLSCRWPMDLIDHSSQSASVPKWCPTFTDEVKSPAAEQAAASSKWYKVAVCIRDTETVCDSFSIHHVLVGDILPLYMYLLRIEMGIGHNAKSERNRIRHEQCILGSCQVRKLRVMEPTWTVK